jgi:mannan endo-1,4-beta-mannosidase
MYKWSKAGFSQLAKAPKIMKITASIAVILSLGGCLGGEDLNTETETYVPEARPLNVIAQADIEAKPGDTVELSSRLVGTANGESLVWSQLSGTVMDIDDLTSPTLKFDIPTTLLSDRLVFQVAAVSSSGDPVDDADGEPLLDTIEVTVFDPESVIVLDVSSSAATLNGALLVVPGDDQYVDGADNDTHTADIEPGQSVTFTIDNESGFYTLNVRYVIPSDYGGKQGNVSVNGVDNAMSFEATGQWKDYRVGVINLNDGVNTIEVGGGWSYYRIDNISLIPAAQPAEPLAVPSSLNNPNAIDEAKELMVYLADNYASATLSGQTEFPRKDGDTFPLTEFDKIVSATGDDAPAIVAFDYMNYSASYAGTDASGLTEAMIAAKQEKNITVSALFHWRAPSGNNDAGDGSFYTDGTSFNFAAALADTTSDEYAQLLNDIDTVAIELLKLQEAGIPVLWRPLHEAEGGWFWWGAQGADALKELWTLMHDRMTNTHGLNNLIWIYTHTEGLGADWYPGDAYVDIVGFDGYASPRNDPNAVFATQYKTLMERHNGKKMVALTETGTIPNIELMHEQRAWWSFFITWNSEVWDPSSVIGPQGADPADVDAHYAYSGLINLADLPGGTMKFEAGSYDDFDVSTLGFQAQLSWSPTAGIVTSDRWAASGSRSLALHKDLSAETNPTNVVFQTYPEGGIDVTDVTTLTVHAQAINSGAMTSAKLWAKDADGLWRDAGATTTGSDALSLSIDISDLSSLQGFGVVFENFDAASTNAGFYIDSVQMDDKVVYDFEPNTSGFQSQVNWSPTAGLTVTKDWATSGAQALTIIKDISALEQVNNVIFQTYPAAGIDVAGVAMLKVSAHAVNAGADITIKLWAKDAEGTWRDAGATLIADDGLELAIDVSDLDILQGFGLQIQNVDSASTDARFYLDNVRLDDNVMQDFENTNDWEFQVNWSPVAGLQLSSEWATNGDSSLSGKVQLVDGDDNIILQTYPQGGIPLGDVASVSLDAYALNAGDAVSAKLWAKNQDGEWRDGGAVQLVDGSVTLSVDVSDYESIQGFGVQFRGAVNSESESQYFIDRVVFE